jgi:hypothetical protein
MSLIMIEVKVIAVPPLVLCVCSPSHHILQGSENPPLQILPASNSEKQRLSVTNQQYHLATRTTNLNMTRITSHSLAANDSEVTYAEIAGTFDCTKTMSDQLQVLLNIIHDTNELGKDREPLKDFLARLEQRQHVCDELRRESIVVNGPT